MKESVGTGQLKNKSKAFERLTDSEDLTISLSPPFSYWFYYCLSESKCIDNEYILNYNEIERTVVITYFFGKEGLYNMAQLSMRIDDVVKKKAELACDALGMSMSTAINIYLVKLGNEMRIPFEGSVDPFYSSANQSVLEESIRQLKAGKGTEHDLIEED